MKKYQTKPRLNTIKSCNILLARVINSMQDQTIEENEARTIGYLVNILIKGLEKSDLEQRIEELEDKISEKVG